MLFLYTRENLRRQAFEDLGWPDARYVFLVYDQLKMHVLRESVCDFCLTMSKDDWTDPIKKQCSPVIPFNILTCHFFLYAGREAFRCHRL